MMIELINFFKSAIITETKIDPIGLNSLAVQHGYIIHPDCCNQHTLKFIVAQEDNYNSTFYKTWDDVKSKSQEQIFLDKLMHYASTYGTNYNGPTYTCNEDPIKIEYNTYTIISPISQEEMYNKCRDVVYSGIALNKNTLKVICDYLIDNIDNGLDIDKVKNRDAKIIICDELGIFPSNADELFKYIYYKTTGSTMVIKSRDMIDEMKRGGNFDWNSLSEDNLKTLAQVFNRHKKLFLAVKHQNRGKYISVINKISKYSKKYHKPYHKGFWETLLSDPKPLNDIKGKLGELNNFKIISLWHAISNRIDIIESGEGKDLHVIRNNKIFIAEPKYFYSYIYYYKEVQKILFDKLCDNIRSKACIVRFPKYLHLTCPMSEKQFVGNIPYGSRYDLGKNNYIGIYWRNEWGAKDLDISYLDRKGEKYGWNSYYRDEDNSIMYSGDMTNADPEATEILACKQECPDGIIKVNRYNGEGGAKYKLFFGTQPIQSMHKNYMVDPNTIRFEQMLESEGAEQVVACVKNNSAYFTSLTSSSYRIVSSVEDDLQKCMDRKLDNYLELKKLLIAAGFEEYDEHKHDKIDLDLCDLKKDSLISLFNMDEEGTHISRRVE